MSLLLVFAVFAFSPCALALVIKGGNFLDDVILFLLILSGALAIFGAPFVVRFHRRHLTRLIAASPLDCWGDGSAADASAMRR